MEKIGEVETIVREETFELDEAISAESTSSVHDVWTREYVEGNDKAVWIPHGSHGNKLSKPFRVPVMAGSDSFILEKQYSNDE